MNYIPFIRDIISLPSAWTRFRFHERQSWFHVILNIPGNSIAESDNGTESRGKCEKKRRAKWISICRVRIRVTVANKFELSCTIDRSFHSEPSRRPLLLFSFSDLLKFYAVSRWERSDSKVLLTAAGWPDLILRGRKRGSFSISLHRAYFILPRSKGKKRERERERETRGNIRMSLSRSGMIRISMKGFIRCAGSWLRNTCFVAWRVSAGGYIKSNNSSLLLSSPAGCWITSRVLAFSRHGPHDA